LGLTLIFTTFNSKKGSLTIDEHGFVIADKTWHPTAPTKKQKFLEYLCGTNLALWYFGDDQSIINKFHKEKTYDVEVGGQQTPFLLDMGFYDQEFDTNKKPFRWTNGHARIYFPDENRKICSMDSDFTVYNPKGTSLGISVNEIEIFKGHIMPGRWENNLLFPNEGASAGTVVVKIDTDVWRPINGDSRELGIAVRSIRLNSCGSTKR
jgi:hypothetical protein